jgi:hypothetical protein
MSEWLKAYKWWLLAAVAILVVAVVITVVASQNAEQDPIEPTLSGLTPTYNVLDYGAKNDGTGIQDAAILKACYAAKGAIVYFPAGNYSVSKAFKLPYGTIAKGATGATQSYLMVIMPQPDGTVSWKFTWVKP